MQPLSPTANHAGVAMRRLGDARSRRLRTMREFAEQEFVIPSGPAIGRRFRCDRQPYVALWFALVASNAWRRMFALGPIQSGKTLIGSILPVMYHLFEFGESVVYGVPTEEMAEDKWKEDLLPAIEASRYAALLPTTGGGAKGAFSTAVKMKNGATLRFMSGGGKDKKRAGFTARVLVVTETDGFDETGMKSREADKFSQLEGRTKAFGDRARVYGECTVSVEEGRTWREYKAGTDSRILRPCPHCRAWVTPDRGNLLGWREAENEPAARVAAAFSCPECNKTWTEAERHAANLRAVVAHRGQEVTPDGTITGMAPQTLTLGFRWTAADNHLRSAGDIGAEEWKASRASGMAAENGEKALRQWTWTLPAESPAQDAVDLKVEAILRCVADPGRGFVPHDAEFVTVGVDLGKHFCWWTAIAWRPGGTPHVIDYGEFGVPQLESGLEASLVAALREFRDGVCEKGWIDPDGEVVQPLMVLVDSSNFTDSAYAFVKESRHFGHHRYWPVKGYGASQDEARTRVKDGRKLASQGEHYRIATIEASGVFLMEHDADHWKTWVHRRIAARAGAVAKLDDMPTGATVGDCPGGLTLFRAEPVRHLQYAKHLIAEKEVEDYKPGKGVFKRWEKVSRNNHMLDTTVYACVGAHYCGARLLGDEPAAEAEPQPRREAERRGFRPLDDRPFLVTERG